MLPLSDRSCRRWLRRSRVSQDEPRKSLWLFSCNLPCKRCSEILPCLQTQIPSPGRSPTTPSRPLLFSTRNYSVDDSAKTDFNNVVSLSLLFSPFSSYISLSLSLSFLYICLVSSVFQKSSTSLSVSLSRRFFRLHFPRPRSPRFFPPAFRHDASSISPSLFMVFYTWSPWARYGLLVYFFLFFFFAFYLRRFIAGLSWFIYFYAGI